MAGKHRRYLIRATETLTVGGSKVVDRYRRFLFDAMGKKFKLTRYKQPVQTGEERVFAGEDPNSVTTEYDFVD